ncbi:hypothetical protein CDD83_1928 [Cordyceps sp. RAO-2017]|nr:hypothetical protein CDD83_1928 [Cordyceps sp. RAO-2017]
MPHYKPLQAILLTTLICLLLLWLSSPIAPPRFRLRPAAARPATPPARSSHLDEIPNDVHFVFLLEKAGADFPFEFHQFLCIYAAWFHLQPGRLFLHTNAGAEQIQRAKQGQAGKWSRLIFEMPGLTVNPVESPTVTNKGVKIKHVAHKSDFIRVQVLRQFGGLYLDLDVFVIRDLRPLMASGFQSVSGREVGGLMTAGAFLAKRDCRLLQMWEKEMHEVFDQGWTTHSNGLMTRIGERLIPEPWEILLLEQDALSPVHWDPPGAEEFIESHPDVASPVEGLHEGDHLPLLQHYDEPGGPWAMNFNKSYAIHAFRVEEVGMEVSPGSVLERRSNIGRALYPVVRDMYHRGLVTLQEK